MKKIELAELKKIQLEILKDVHVYCIKKGINYSLGYGTLIGAIRHKGYIPWDDDIDIIMPRADYEKFIIEFNKENKKYKVIAPCILSMSYAPYANVINTETILVEEHISNDYEMGIKIDVFPIDNVPSNTIRRKILYAKVKLIKELIIYKNNNLSSLRHHWKKILSRVVKSVFSKVDLSLRLEELASAQNIKNLNSGIVNNIVWCACDEKGCFPKSALKEYINVSFENNEFKALFGYDDFLKAHYGDYMKLPPKEKQINHHDFVAYWKC